MKTMSIIITLTSLCIFNCTSTKKSRIPDEKNEISFQIDGHDAKEYFEVLINTGFSFTWYKQLGIWPKDCTEIIRILSDSAHALNKCTGEFKSYCDSLDIYINDESLCRNLMVGKINKDTLQFNWNMIEKMNFKIINDTIIEVKYLAQNNSNSISIFTFPVSTFDTTKTDLFELKNEEKSEGL